VRERVLASPMNGELEKDETIMSVKLHWSIGQNSGSNHHPTVGEICGVIGEVACSPNAGCSPLDGKPYPSPKLARVILVTETRTNWVPDTYGKAYCPGACAGHCEVELL